MAKHLGISVQAVSKWERDEGLPDITLLPRIASYYDTTVDALLGCDDIRRREEISAFEEEAHRMINQGKRAERLALCREMQKKYPNDETVLRNLMYDLYAVDRTKNSEEILSIAAGLLHSESEECRFSAIQMSAFTHAALGHYDEAVQYARMVPDHEDLLVHVLKGEELTEHCRWFFWHVCDSMTQTLGYLLSCPEAGYTAEERHRMRRQLYDFYHVIFSDGDFGFWEDRLGRLSYGMALSSLQAGDADTALDELKKMAEHFEKFERFASIDHTSPFVRGLHYEANQIGRSDERSLTETYLRKLEEPLWDALRDNPRMQTIKKRMKA
ncbi:MAG: helix-turn-helix transcriptional regulator [Ruminococcaceae bacterium]|nr:helix-turn-helix transcriptional regulator [Oscillospiraceae bacterium]